MAITKQFGPSSVSYGDAVYRSGQNQERFTRAMLLQNQGASATAAKADAQYKLGMLDLEKDKWAKQWPLLEKEMDLKEVETWLAKSVEYFKARATAAGARLAAQSMIYQSSAISYGSTPGQSSASYSMSASSSGGGGSYSRSTSASGKEVGWVGGVLMPTNSYTRYGDASMNYNPAFTGGASPEASPFFSSLGIPGGAQLDAAGASARFNKAYSANVASAISKIDEQYRVELARIDEVFGVSQGWTPKLFMTGASEEWNAPPPTPAFGQDPLTGTKPRNDPGASETPFV